MRRLVVSTAWLATCVLVACSDGSHEPEWDGPAGEASSSIIDGVPNTTHQAVVAIFSNQTACTGTIIHKSGSSLYVLTAAHCVTPYTPEYVVTGNNYDSPTSVHAVSDFQWHPGYSSQELIYDFAMIRANGANASTPVIGAMTPAQDNLSINDQVLHVGYGKTSYPNSNNSVRRQSYNTITDLAGIQFLYSMPTTGPCEGDSGGPALSTEGPELVAGVVSFGEEGCSTFGVDGRVSGVYNSFIAPYIGEVAYDNCSACVAGESAGGASCGGQADACRADPACNGLLGCASGCFTNDCFQECVDLNPGGYNGYVAVIDCLCAGECSALCGTEPQCAGTWGPPGTGGGGPVGGGAPVGGSAPVGGGGPLGDNWVAGDADNRGYEGDSLGTCALRTGRDVDHRAGWLGLLLGLGLASARRRRR